ncbi:MAG: CRTAC1 family protein [Planctomycetales bacterium]|nr:CRTAC1 family protein [Planctomycetales bacterium]
MSDKSNTSDHEFDPETEERDDAVIGTALRWSLAVFVILGVVGGAIAFVLTRPAPPPPIQETELATVQVREASKVDIPNVPFTDVTNAAGIHFRHENGARGKKLLPETMGGGCSFFDFDDDGDQDLLLVNGQSWSWDKQPDETPPATLVLYQNDGTGRFEDITKDSGLDISLYGMGAAVGDYDRDGRIDVFVSAVGTNRLFHNEGTGKFRDVTEDAKIGGAADEWSSSCGWFDFDSDGDLDLFVCNYVKWSREYDESQGFQLTGGGRAYGRPQNFEGTFPYLYRNDGEGKFTEVAEAAGLHIRNPATNVPVAKSLGVTFADFDEDGRIDIIVANDTVQNLLFHNQGDGKFSEVGALSGIAFDMSGNARGAMGIDAARFRDNDAIGVAIGNFSNEMTALYVSHGKQMQFMDEAISTGLGPNTRLELTFGVFYFDYDLDGRLDLFAANGHLEEDINRVQPSQHYAQPPQLFWNCGREQDTEFLPVPSANCGTDLLQPMVGRGSAYADIDGDGDLDVLILSSGQTPRLLRNDQQLGHHWLRFELTGTKSNPNAIGAWIEVHLGKNVLKRQVMPTRSYISQSELPITIGLGDSDTVDRVVIRWPDGSVQELGDVAVDQVHTVHQVDAASAALIYRQPRVVRSQSLEQRLRDGLSAAPQALNEHRTLASCGNYLQDSRVHEKDSKTAEDLPRIPCRGPQCSGSPPAQAPPRSPNPVVRVLPEAILLMAITESPTSQWESLLLFRARAIDMGSATFRPPRA